MSKPVIVIVVVGVLAAFSASWVVAQTKSPPVRKTVPKASPINTSPKAAPTTLPVKLPDAVVSGPITAQKGTSLARNEFGTLKSMCEIKGQIFGAEDNKVVLLDEKGAVTRSIATRIKSPTISRFNDATLVIGDRDAKIVYTLDVKSGKTARLVTLDKLKISGMPRAEVVKSGKLASVASDGTYLYAAFSAGFSSSILKIDPKKGAVVGHAWAPGDNPAAMVFDNGNLFVLEAAGKQIRRFDQSLKPSYRWIDVPATDGKGLMLKDGGFRVLSPAAKEVVTIQSGAAELIAAPLSMQLRTPGSIVGSIAQVLPQKYAVLVCGDIAESCYYCDAFWNDTLWMYKTLLAKGYTKENIYVLYGNGTDFVSANPRYQYADTVTDFPATLEWLNTVFDGMKNGDAANGIQKMKATDSLFVWTFDHGAGGNPAYLCLVGDDISDTSFAAKINAVPYAKRAIYMQQCRSGGFVDNLTGAKSFISTACRADQNAYAADTENELYNGVTYWHGEYNYHLISAVSGQTPSGAAVNADADASGKVSALEAHQWIVSRDSIAETPQMNDMGAVGSTYLY